MKRSGKMVVAVVLALAVSIFGVTGTVMGQSNRMIRIEERGYRVLEQEYTAKIKELLIAKGYTNSGVMMTRVVDSDGSRQYTVTVHHDRINSLTEEGRAALWEELEACAFEAPDCTFIYDKRNE